MKRLLLILILCGFCHGQVTLSGTVSVSGTASLTSVVSTPTAPTPTFSADTGAAQDVTITAAASVICYTTNGTDPAASTPGTCSAGTTYSAPVHITSTTTFKALATAVGSNNSVIASQTYTISAGVPITHVASGTGCSKSAASTNAGAATVVWTCTPGAANRALAIGAECSGVGTATLAALTASPSSGWTFTPMTTVTSAGGAAWFATWGTITPNTTSTTFTATFTGLTNCQNFTAYFSDEFQNADTAGGTTTFYSHVTPATQTGCATTTANTTSSNANDAVWALCLDNLPYPSSWADTGNGWATGVSDQNGDATIWKAGSGVLTPGWTGSSGAGSFTTTIAIKAQ